MINPYQYAIILSARMKLTNHARKRFYERYEGKKPYKPRDIKRIVARKIVKDIRKGIPVEPTGAMRLNILDCLDAIVVCGNIGYEIVTFIKREETENDEG